MVLWKYENENFRIYYQWLWIVRYVYMAAIPYSHQLSQRSTYSVIILLLYQELPPASEQRATMSARHT